MWNSVWKDKSLGLEDKVAERTQELAEQVAELERMNRMMVGRELKMVELKKEIAALKGEPRSNIDREELRKSK